MPTSLAAPAATLTPPAIGQLWPEQGGIYAGICRGAPGQPDHHLILAEAALGALSWGPDTLVAGAKSERDGLANTRALVAAKTDHPAAQACAALVVGEHADFYLPSRFELALLYANLSELFEDRWHWSSTQYSRYNAWGQYFGGGFQGYGDKSFEARVRAVRRSILQPFNPSVDEATT